MKQKRAIVTGAGVGIGYGVAKRLAEEGYRVVVHYFSTSEGADALCEYIRSLGGQAWAIQADLSKKEQIDSFFDTAIDKLGGLDLFVNNAGITKKSNFAETTEELFDLLVSVDLKSAYFCVQRAANEMAAQKEGGSIIVMSSNNGVMQTPGVSVYGSVKAALIKMVRHAAIEYAHQGIRINAIAPGWTLTSRTAAEEEETVMAKIPLSRWCRPEEIGDMVLFLSSPCAASITGNCLFADGGARLLSAPKDAYIN